MKRQDVCPVCKNTDFVGLHKLRIEDKYKLPEKGLRSSNNYQRNYILFEMVLERRVEKVEVEFRLCRRCGLIFFSPRPDELDMSLKYKIEAEQHSAVKRMELKRIVDIRELRANSIAQLLAQYWRQNSGRAVDIGGGDGHCLGCLTSIFDCEVVDPVHVSLWPGVKQCSDTLSDLADDDLFDVILCCHTLEHIPDVNSFVADIIVHLCDGGLLYVEVPYGCSGEIYLTENVLTHINFFSEGSLGYLLENQGLEIEYMVSKPVLTSSRYLGVVQVVAKKEGETSDMYYRNNASRITEEQMSRSLDKRVTLANIRLVLSHPLKYGVGFMLAAGRRVSGKVKPAVLR